MDKKKLIFGGLTIAALLVGVVKRAQEIRRKDEVIDITNETTEEPMKSVE